MNDREPAISISVEAELDEEMYSRVYAASSPESVVDRVEHALRVTDVAAKAKAVTKTPPYCRASVTPPTMSGYTPCMKVLPCPLHGDNPSFHERGE